MKKAHVKLFQNLPFLHKRLEMWIKCQITQYSNSYKNKPKFQTAYINLIFYTVFNIPALLGGVALQVLHSPSSCWINAGKCMRSGCIPL